MLLQEKKEETEGVPEKVSKLAINMEGGFQTEKNVDWDEKLSVVVLPDMTTLDITDPGLPLGLQLSVAGVRTAVSAQTKAAVEAAQVNIIAAFKTELVARLLMISWPNIKYLLGNLGW